MHKLEGGPPGPRPTPPSACWRLHDADIADPTAGRGRPARTRGSALQLTSEPRCRENYVTLRYLAFCQVWSALEEPLDSPDCQSDFSVGSLHAQTNLVLAPEHLKGKGDDADLGKLH